jgi:hypothetical protein
MRRNEFGDNIIPVIHPIRQANRFTISRFLYRRRIVKQPAIVVSFTQAI